MLICLTLNLILASFAEGMGSCRIEKKCCDGKDTDCSVQKGNFNSIILNMEDEPCYCDHGCLDMGDCCSDFKDYCGGEDTVSSEIITNT